MNNSRRFVFPALLAAGVLWGTTVPLSKVALGWLPPGWLAFARFALAAAVLMVASRSRLRAACSPAILATGAIGYGGSVLLQNFGIQRTSVTHAALLIGATPVLVAVIATMLRHSVARPLAWAGFALSLAGVAFIAGGRGSGSSLAGDGLVLAAQLLSAGFTVSQARLLRGRDPVAVTGLQLMAAAVAVLPVAVISEHHVAGPMSVLALLSTIGLVVAGTVLPTSLFAFGQSRVTADVAGAFLNLEPLVGAIMGMALFAEPAGPVQIAGGAAIMTGIVLSSFQVVRFEHRRRVGTASSAVAEGASAPAAAVSPAAVSSGELASAGLSSGELAPAGLPSAGAAATIPATSGVAAGSLPAPGEAPSLVRRTRYPQPRHAEIPRVRPGRFGPAGRRVLGAGRRRSRRKQPGRMRPSRERAGRERAGRERAGGRGRPRKG
jgi:O-acetylserine/cysteine efflux transporter